VEETKHLIKNL